MTQAILFLLRLDRKRLKKLNITINTLKIKIKIPYGLKNCI